MEEEVFLWDWKTWMKDSVRKITGLSSFRAFKVMLNEEEEVVLYYKDAHSSSNTPWLGFQGHLTNGKFLEMFLLLFTLGIQPLKNIPLGFPKLIPLTPIPEQAFQDIPDFYSSISSQAKTWWQDYLSNPLLPSQVVPEGFLFF